MKAWCDVLVRDWLTRVRLIGLLSGLLLGGIVYWWTGVFLSAALAALAGAAVVMMLGRYLKRRQARMRALEETVEALREQVRQLQGGAAVESQGALPPSIVPQRSATYERRGRVSSILSALEIAAQRTVSAWKRLWVWLVGDNAAVRVGVVVLFFGVASLIKYAYENARVLPVGARLVGVAVAATVLLAIGWRLREKRPAYAQALQGGGVGLLYLAVFGATDHFNLLQFVLLIAVIVLAGVLAIRQNARWIAILGIAGGFLAPLLISDGGSGMMLFSYYLALNLGIFAIALHKSWRSLNALGLLFTFGVASVWGARFYLPEHFGSTEPFLVLFFLLYVSIAVIYAMRQAPRFDDYVDSTIVFGAPLLAFALQVQLVRHIEHGAAWSALAVSALYFVLAATIHRRHQQTLRMLVEAFLVLGLIFATITLPLASLDGRWTAGVWALEGAAVYWMGSRQGKPLVRIAGLLLQFGAGVALIADMHRGVIELPVLNGFFLSCVFIAFAGLFCSRIMERHAGEAGDSGLQASIAVFLWGLAWWLLGGLHEISVHAPRVDVHSASLLFFTGTCAAFSFLRGHGWSAARFPALALPPLMAIVLLLRIVEDVDGHPLASLGAVAWPVAFLFHFRILRRHEDAYPRDLSFAHSLGMWLLAAVGTWEVAWQIDHLAKVQYPWPVVAWILVPIALLALVAAIRSSWPVVRYPGAYLWTGVKPLIAFLVLWMLYANIPSDAEPASPRYIPLLNPLDLAHVLAFGILVYWWRAVRASGIDGPREFPSTWPVTAWCVAIFFWANAVLLRTLHHYAGVPYQFQAMLESNLVQMCVSIFWTVLALATMFVATRRRIRQMWIVGSVLMGAVVLKLLIIELPRASAVESVVSIITVGVLMLVVGYVAPVPPRQIDAA